MITFFWISYISLKNEHIIIEKKIFFAKSYLKMYFKIIAQFLSLILLMNQTANAKRNYFYDFVVESYKKIILNYQIETSPYLLRSKTLFGKPQSLTMIMNFNWDGTSDFMLGNQDGMFWSDMGKLYFNLLNKFIINWLFFPYLCHELNFFS